MKEIQTNGKTILFVEVPEDVIFRIEYDGLLAYQDADSEMPNFINIPSGNYQILGKSTELSEEQIKGICEQKEITSYGFDGLIFITLYRNYLLPDNDWKLSCDQFSNIQESYLSLLEANGICDRPKTTTLNLGRIDIDFITKVKTYLVLEKL